ncbi:MAG: septum formation initiator family protein [Candidatus Neomarinimicrobiota bacterium]
MAYKNKNEKKTFDSSARLKVIVIVILICLALLLLNNNGLLYLFKAKEEHEDLIEEKIDLETKQALLLNEKKMLENNESYIEKTAREQYNMVKPGEKVYKVITE